MLLQLLPLAIAGAFVPTWTSRVIILLATDRPLFNGFAFIAGNFAYRFILGIAALYILDISTLNSLTESSETAPAIFLVSAALLFSLAIWLWHQGTSGKKNSPVG